MFIVFNKEKISTYIILLSTVVILFGIAFNLMGNNVVETSINSIEQVTNKIIDKQ